MEQTLSASNSTSSAARESAATSESAGEKVFCIEGWLAWCAFVAVALILLGFLMFLLRKCIQGPRYCKKNRIDGKVVIITGCNTGIGKQTALELARRGAKIYMACRDAARCEAARLEIIEQTHNQRVYNRTLDLASLASVRQFAAQFLREEQRLDVLINNAGIMATPRKLTVDGYEQQFAVNHLGHFLLTRLLLDRLKQSAPSRVVVVTSAAGLIGRINRKDLQSERKYSKFLGAYAQSKLANILFTLKLAEQLAGTKVSVNCCHPGIVRTELGRYNECARWLWSSLMFVARFAAKSPQAGAQTTLRLALDPALETASGGYYSDSIRWPLPPWVKDAETADWLWQESERLVGLSSSSSSSNGGGGGASSETTSTHTMETVVVNEAN